MNSNFFICQKASRVGALVLGSLLLSSCGGGDTDGGEGNDTANPANYVYTADGGAGASIELQVDNVRPRVGQQVGYRVILRDPQGLPLEHIPVFCQSEKGIAILEPSTGTEHTSINGIMSGFLGANLPGSYMLECRAQDGFGLQAQISLVISGSGSGGFDAFGEDIGGGRVLK